MSVTLKINARSLRTAFIDRCYDEGADPVQALEAWLRRALRQEATIMPRSERLGNVRQIGQRKA